jgi:hypothetical protein
MRSQFVTSFGVIGNKAAFFLLLYAIVTRNLRDLQGAQLRFSALRVISPENFLKKLLT